MDDALLGMRRSVRWTLFHFGAVTPLTARRDALCISAITTACLYEDFQELIFASQHVKGLAKLDRYCNPSISSIPATRLFGIGCISDLSQSDHNRLVFASYMPQFCRDLKSVSVLIHVLLCVALGYLNSTSDNRPSPTHNLKSRLATTHEARVQASRPDSVLVCNPGQEALKSETISAVGRCAVPVQEERLLATWVDTRTYNSVRKATHTDIITYLRWSVYQ